MKDDVSLQVLKLSFGLVSLIILLPMWLVLLGWLLSAADAPAWVWGLYWCYVPVSIFLGVVKAFVESE